MANLYVQYNGLVMGPLDDPSGLCGGGACAIPTPYVSRSERVEYSGKISYRVTDINISGKVYSKNLDSIYGSGNEFSEIETRRNAILNAFDDDFHTLTAGNYTFYHVKVNEVNFSEGNTGVLEFSVSLTSYGEWFKSTGVKEVKNEYNYSKGDDGVVVCRHSISVTASRSNNLSGWGDSESDPI